METSQAKWAYWCDSDKAIIVVTSHFLIGFHAHCALSNSSFVIIPGQNSKARVILSPDGEAIVIVLLNEQDALTQLSSE